MKQIITFFCTSHCPTDDELREAIIYANTKDCFVHIQWENIGRYMDSITIEPGCTFEQAKNSLPKVIAM